MSLPVGCWKFRKWSLCWWHLSWPEGACGSLGPEQQQRSRGRTRAPGRHDATPWQRLSSRGGNPPHRTTSRCATWSLCCKRTTLGGCGSDSETVVAWKRGQEQWLDIHDLLKAELITLTEEPKVWHEKDRTQGKMPRVLVWTSGKTELQLTELGQVWEKSQFSSRHTEWFNQRFSQCGQGTPGVPCDSSRVLWSKLFSCCGQSWLQILAQRLPTPPLNRN